MNSERECYVYIVLPGTTQFVTAAKFQLSTSRDGTTVGRLVYGKNYLARTDAIELDPVELRLGDTQYQTIRMEGFFGAIRDAMPDYWGRKVIEHAIRPPLAEFDFLMLGADDRAGALGFGLNVQPPAPRKYFNQTLDLALLQKTAEIIYNNGDIESKHTPVSIQKQIQALLLEGTSMGGARPKAIIEDNQHLWIAKFSTPQDRWNQPVVEHAMLKLAAMCGLSPAESKLITVGGKNVLLVKRFDRDKAKNEYYRHRMISALTLLKSDDDPASKNYWSYLLLADEVRRISKHPKADLKELFGRMCFNALVSNLDDHPRNHAMIARDNQWQLSPAYDLTPTLSIAKDSRFLAMSCGLQGRIAKKENLLSAHHRFLLTRNEAEQIIDQMTTIIKQEWYASFRRAGVSEKDCTTISNAFIYEGFLY